MAIRQGSIVFYELHPPRGEAKTRRVVVTTPDDEIGPGCTLEVLGISGSYYPGKKSSSELLWQPQGNCVTRCNKPSAIQTDWAGTVPFEALRDDGKWIGQRALAETLQALAEALDLSAKPDDT